MNTRARFALDLLGPPFIASVLFTLGLAVAARTLESLAAFPAVLISGYAYAIVPGLAHALWMRSRYRAGLDPRSNRTVGIMILTGLGAGAAIAGLFLIVGAGFHPFLIFLPLGAATGVFNALLHRMVPRAPPTKTSPTEP